MGDEEDKIKKHKGVHASGLLTGIDSRVDAFLNWADDCIHRDRSAGLQLDGTPSRIGWVATAWTGRAGGRHKQRLIGPPRHPPGRLRYR